MWPSQVKTWIFIASQLLLDTVSHFEEVIDLSFTGGLELKPIARHICVCVDTVCLNTKYYYY